MAGKLLISDAEGNPVEVDISAFLPQEEAAGLTIAAPYGAHTWQGQDIGLGPTGAWALDGFALKNMPASVKATHRVPRIRRLNPDKTPVIEWIGKPAFERGFDGALELSERAEPGGILIQTYIRGKRFEFLPEAFSKPGPITANDFHWVWPGTRCETRGNCTFEVNSRAGCLRLTTNGSIKIECPATELLLNALRGVFWALAVPKQSFPGDVRLRLGLWKGEGGEEGENECVLLRRDGTQNGSRYAFRAASKGTGLPVLQADAGFGEMAGAQYRFQMLSWGQGIYHLYWASTREVGGNWVGPQEFDLNPHVSDDDYRFPVLQLLAARGRKVSVDLYQWQQWWAP